MMKWVLIYGFSTLLSDLGTVHDIRLKCLRDNYEKAVSDKKLCETIIQNRNSFSQVIGTKELPGILGYNDNIKNDKSFLKSNLDRVQSGQLKKMIANILMK